MLSAGLRAIPKGEEKSKPVCKRRLEKPYASCLLCYISGPKTDAAQANEVENDSPRRGVGFLQQRARHGLCGIPEKDKRD